MPQRLTNKLGHRIGARGSRTRRALLDAMRGLLNTRHLGEIRVADVAAAAGLAPSNFYTYFKEVDEPVLDLCDDAAEDCQALSAYLDADWSADRAFITARALIIDMKGIWDRHGPVLRIEHELAAKGEEAFAESRIRRLRRLHLAIERRIAQARAQGFHPEDFNPRLASYEVVSLIESVAAGFDLLRRADTPEAILDTSAHIVVRIITGR
ncbi:TetR/AcrR family transcriptional regulator [Rhizobium sp. CRIBSB]|nr:TetR/AcrR family transcriptional regulator [Rhizobium sp. CRIBSB]